MTLVSASIAHAQENLDGYYKRVCTIDNGEFIYIKGDKFKYGVYQCPPETICTATYRWINKHFIELQSVPLKNIIDDSLRVHQFKSGSDDDSLTVYVSLPDASGRKLKCNILYLPKNDDRGVWEKTIPTVVDSRNGLKVKLPVKTGKIVLRVEPNKRNNIYHPVEWRVYYNVGYLYYLSREITIKEGMDSVRIEIPILKTISFEDYVANGEYASVKEGRIIWLGWVFERVSDIMPPWPPIVETIPLTKNKK